MLGAAAYVTWTLNLWGPIMNVTSSASAQALEEGKKRLRDFLESSETGRQALGYAPDSFEMKPLDRNSTSSSAARRSGEPKEKVEDLDEI